MKTRITECNLCGSGKYKVVYKRSEKTKGPDRTTDNYLISEAHISKPDKVLKCNNCGLVFAEIEQDSKYYTDAYADMVDETYVQEEAGRRKAAADILKRIERYKKPGKILDIGCANGFFLDEARKKGWQVYGVEISKWASEYAKTKLNLGVIRGQLGEAGFSDEFFDVIVMLDVIEHLVDPKHVLIESRRILKHSGLLYISTPDIASFISRALKAKWWGINKFHLFYFSKKTLEKMLDACGFNIKRFSPHIRIFSFNYWVKRFEYYNRLLYKALDFISRIAGIGKAQIAVNLHDQIEVMVTKSRKLDYLVRSVEAKKKRQPRKDVKVFVVLPAYNAEKTLERTVNDIPKGIVDKIILVDDKSSDKTVSIAKKLGLDIFQHKKNMGYGGNQKTCYRKALEGGADIAVMVHPDYQYDPAIIPQLIFPIQEGRADAVFGSRMMKGGALEGGMPLWKHNVNILLTALENVVLGTYLTEYHSGFRAYSANLLKTVNFELNSDKFVFDTEIIVQALIHHFKIEEVPIQTRYFEEASKIKLMPAVLYGFGILWTMVKYVLHIKRIYKFRQFE